MTSKLDEDEPDKRKVMKSTSTLEVNIAKQQNFGGIVNNA